jgi:hypothetical protein
MRLLPPVTPLSHLCGPSMMLGVEVSHPKTINKNNILAQIISRIKPIEQLIQSNIKPFK